MPKRPQTTPHAEAREVRRRAIQVPGATQTAKSETPLETNDPCDEAVDPTNHDHGVDPAVQQHQHWEPRELKYHLHVIILVIY